MKAYFPEEWDNPVHTLPETRWLKFLIQGTQTGGFTAYKWPHIGRWAPVIPGPRLRERGYHLIPISEAMDPDLARERVVGWLDEVLQMAKEKPRIPNDYLRISLDEWKAMKLWGKRSFSLRVYEAEPRDPGTQAVASGHHADFMETGDVKVAFPQARLKRFLMKTPVFDIYRYKLDDLKETAEEILRKL